MDKLSALWKGASYQDKLLQSYRSLNLIIQSTLLIIGSIISIAVVSIGQPWLCYFLLVLVSFASFVIVGKMKGLIKSRAQDVDYFHNQIILAEKSLPKEEQVLTAFKVYQKFGRGEQHPENHFTNFLVTDSIAAQLTEKGKGHSRKFLDEQLLYALLIIWIGLHLISLMSIFLSPR